MLAMLLAYDSGGNVIATLDTMTLRNNAGEVVGLIDFEAHEAAGGPLTDIWNVAGAAGSGTWPEWIGGRAHQFTVELVGPPGQKRINALVHKTSGFRRERAAIEAAIAALPQDRHGHRNALPITGDPNRPLTLDANGRNAPPVPRGSPHLPIIGAGNGPA